MEKLPNLLLIAWLLPLVSFTIICIGFSIPQMLGKKVPYDKQVVSAHRMPDDMFAFAEGAAARGVKVIIAGAGGAAHLPGMLAAKTTVPVLGVPVASRHLSGLDSRCW